MRQTETYNKEIDSKGVDMYTDAKLHGLEESKR